MMTEGKSHLREVKAHHVDLGTLTVNAQLIQEILFLEIKMRTFGLFKLKNIFSLLI